MSFNDPSVCVLFTSRNAASRNIAENLLSIGEFEEHGKIKDVEGKEYPTWSYGQHVVVSTDAPSVLDVPTGFDFNYLLVLSSHRSKNRGEMLTVHIPGNWGEAKMGGESETLNIAAPFFSSLLLRRVHGNNSISWPLFLEADHHGPTIDRPIVFVEIGSEEVQHTDRRAGEVIASAVMDFLKKDVEKIPQLIKSKKCYFGVGGGHYAKEFTELVLSGEYFIGHIAPKYVIDGLDDNLFSQAIERSTRKADGVILLRKSTNQRHKRKILSFCEKGGLEYIQL